jgi:hypothetical protein
MGRASGEARQERGKSRAAEYAARLSGLADYYGLEGSERTRFVNGVAAKTASLGAELLGLKEREEREARLEAILNQPGLSVSSIADEARGESAAVQAALRVREELTEHLRGLQDVRRDLARQLMEKKRIVEVLDFSEVFLYTRARPQSKAERVLKPLVDYVIESAERPFVLWPASCWELLRDLYRLTKQWQALTEEGRARDLATHRSILQLREVVSTGDHEEAAKIIDRIGDRAQAVELLMERKQGEGPSYILSRLESMLTSRLVSINEVPGLEDARVVNLPLAEPRYTNMFNLLYSRLGQRTFASDLNNFIDAWNFVSTYACNDLFYGARDSYFVIVTHSAVPLHAYRQFQWDRDPWLEELQSLGERTFICRHPSEVSMLRLAKQRHEGDLAGAFGYVDMGVELLSDIVRPIQQLNQLRRWLTHMERDPDSSALRVIRSTAGRLAASLRKYQELYEDPLIRFVESGLLSDATAAEEARRWITAESGQTGGEDSELAYYDALCKQIANHRDVADRAADAQHRTNGQIASLLDRVHHLLASLEPELIDSEAKEIKEWLASLASDHKARRRGRRLASDVGGGSQ